MKFFNSFYHQSKLLTLLALIFMGALSCSKENTAPQPSTPQDQTKMLLLGTWKLQSESASGVDQTGLYQGFEITFTSSDYTTTNSDVIWPHHGTWSFDGTTTNIRRNDGIVVQADVNATTLVMTLVWTQTTLGSGKINSTSGQNVFTMVK